MRSGQSAVDGHNRAARLALSCSADRSAVYRRKRLYTLTTMELRFLAGQIESSTDCSAVARLRAESDSYARRLLLVGTYVCKENYWPFLLAARANFGTRSSVYGFNLDTTPSGLRLFKDHPNKMVFAIFDITHSYRCFRPFCVWHFVLKFISLLHHCLILATLSINKLFFFLSYNSFSEGQ